MYCSYPNIPKGFVKWAKKNFGSDLDKIDVNAVFDKTLSVAENQTIFKQQFSSYFKDEIKNLKEANEQMAEIERKTQISTLQNRFGVELRFVQG